MSLIGVFDSGIGGLTVLKVLANEFPQHDFLYLGDTARLPYGSKSPATIRKYSEQIIESLITLHVDAIVIACNSASSQVPEKMWGNIPIFNVIDPGSLLAVKTSTSQRIGVLGTRATINSNIYAQKIKALSVDAQVFSQSCPLFVPLAEEGWIDDPISNLIVYRYLQPLLANNIDTLVMGCTHYPLLKTAIARVCGSQIALVESGFAIAEEMRKHFRESESAKPVTNHPQRIRLLATDLSNHTKSWAEQIFEPLHFTSIEMVDLL